MAILTTDSMFLLGLITAWDTDVPSLRTVQRWIKEVNDGARTGLDDAARPGRPRSSRTDEMKSKVRDFN